ncbi:unnamed protein product [Alopecurus aequalis]
MATISRRVVPAVLLVLLLLVATEMGTTRVAEARHCQSQSHRYHGACWSDSNCQHVCHTERFPSGECKFHGVERKGHCPSLCP